MFTIRLRIAESTDGAGRKTYGQEQEMTVHAPDENAAKALVQQQNPGCDVVQVAKSQAA